VELTGGEEKEVEEEEVEVEVGDASLITVVVCVGKE
jgi:hypothetical protein